MYLFDELIQVKTRSVDDNDDNNDTNESVHTTDKNSKFAFHDKLSRTHIKCGFTLHDEYSTRQRALFTTKAESIITIYEKVIAGDRQDEDDNYIFCEIKLHTSELSERRKYKMCACLLSVCVQYVFFVRLRERSIRARMKREQNNIYKNV